MIGTEARPAPGLPSPRIVFAGRLHPDKGPDVLVEASGLLRDPPPTPILGDGRPRGVPQRRVRELGLAKRVSFRGWVGDPGPFIAGAAVLAIPSRDEAFSQTAIIGLAHGVPVIGTEVDGFPSTLAGAASSCRPRTRRRWPRRSNECCAASCHGHGRCAAWRTGHAPARVAAIYERTYRGLVAPDALAARAVS